LEYDSKYIKVSFFPLFDVYGILIVLFIEAYYRRASAYMALGKYPSALSDYEYVS
jgi:hypothetical protein